MIGIIHVAASCSSCIGYCLEDKKTLSDEQKAELSARDGLRHKDRAEVLEYNQCFGDKKELVQQFNDVMKLNTKVKKPVVHISLRPAPGDKLSKAQFIDIGQAAAREFGIDKNQYLCILHTDTAQPHIHIVGNRVGFDGKLASDSFSYGRIAGLCRVIEKDYGLRQIESYWSRKDPAEPRLPQHHNLRNETLKGKIELALKDSTSYTEFEKKMKESGHRIARDIGIAFEDSKRIWIRGSNVGFPLHRIETINKKNYEQKWANIWEALQKPTLQQQLPPELRKEEQIKKKKKKDRSMGR